MRGNRSVGVGGSCVYWRRCTVVDVSVAHGARHRASVLRDVVSGAHHCRHRCVCARCGGVTRRVRCAAHAFAVVQARDDRCTPARACASRRRTRAEVRTVVRGRAHDPVQGWLDACTVRSRAHRHVIRVAPARAGQHRVRGVVAGGAAAVR
jgi:hypothetical protein